MKLYELLDCYFGKIEIYGFSCEDGYEVLYGGCSTKVPSIYMNYTISRFGIIDFETLGVVLI